MILCVSLVVSPFSFSFIDLDALFSLVSVARGLSIWFIFSRNNLLGRLQSFLFSVLFISALIFVVSFLLLTLGSVCSSNLSSSLRCRVRLLT